jgi:hypothetical protein
MRKLADWQVLQPVLKTQREILQEVLLCAARYDVWMTLEELAHKTRYPEASISAQLRHLRKAQHGGFEVEKRRRLWAETTRPSAHEKVWEYQMRYGRWDTGREMEAVH